MGALNSVVVPREAGESRMRRYGPSACRAGFSLGEMLVTVVIGAMILTAILTIYGRANQAADAVLQRIESPSRAAEVLQLIAKDLDDTLGADDMMIVIRNGLDNNFARAELVLRRTFHDRENKVQVLKEITWRAGYDREGEVPGLILYRSYNGVAPEDKLLDDGRQAWEKNYSFVPICRGLTFFQILACKGDELVDRWSTPAPPSGVQVTLSFAEPYETVRGTWEVTDEEKISRTFVVDATRKIKFVASAASEPNESTDPNAPTSDKEKGGERGSKDQTTKGRTTDERTSTQKTPGGGMTNKQMPKGRTTNGSMLPETKPKSR